MSEEQQNDPFDRSHYALLKQAVDALAGVCDGALLRDDKGFDGGDTKAGHLYAFLPLDAWPLSTFHRAWQWSRKYHRQLKTIDCSHLPEPPLFADEQLQIALMGDGKGYHVVFPNNDFEQREAFRRLQGSRTHKVIFGSNDKASFWHRTFVGNGRVLFAFAEHHGFRLGPGVRERLLSPGEVRYEAKSFSLYFQDRALNPHVKAIPYSTYSSVGGFHWVIPAREASVGAFRAFLVRHSFSLSGDVEDRLKALEQG